jgi:predicted dinucleotide-binding enzyme
MRIGILGAGMIGGTVGALLARAGHEVLIASRSHDKRDAVVAQIGERARGVEADVAIRDTDAVLLAVPLAAVPALGDTHRDLWAGRVVLDACNPFRGRDGATADAALSHERGTAGYVADALPGARVVKAFNTVYFKTLENEAHRQGDRVGIPLAGDDESALALVETLVHDAGFEAVKTGALETCKRFEVGTVVYNTGMSATKIRSALALPTNP